MLFYICFDFFILKWHLFKWKRGGGTGLASDSRKQFNCILEGLRVRIKVFFFFFFVFSFLIFFFLSGVGEGVQELGGFFSFGFYVFLFRFMFKIFQFHNRFMIKMHLKSLKK